MQTTSATLQQQPPQPGGVVVYERILSDFGDMPADLLSKFTERYEFGMQKYGQPLMTNDGRVTDIEIEQEVLDKAFYSYKGFIETGDPFYRNLFLLAIGTLISLGIQQVKHDIQS